MSLTPLPDGALRWTTPTGTTHTTHPPHYGTDDDLPPEGPLGAAGPPGAPVLEPPPSADSPPF